MPTAEAPPLPRRRRLARAGRSAALAGLLSAAALAGCGSSSHSNGTTADPAGVTPASAPLYLGATVRPGGSEAAAPHAEQNRPVTSAPHWAQWFMASPPSELGSRRSTTYSRLLA